ncbi:isocitrate/isopropylmalate dehydrogenase family protein [Methanopyrus sp.]
MAFPRSDGVNASPTVVVIPGDGIGPEVIDAALKVVRAVLGDELEIVEEQAGYSLWKKRGITIEDETVERCREADAVLFGACTTPEDPEAESPIVTLRKELELYANVRPARSWPVPRPVDTEFDLVIVRENTEGLYTGCECEVHDSVTVALRKISEEGTCRVAEIACDLAEERSGRVTIVHKANVLKLTCGTFKRVAAETVERRGLEWDDEYVDAAAYKLVREPNRFDVILTSNLFGDILSDLAAGLMGSLGLAPSANLGDDAALFESVHGSAPDIAGKGIANPVAAILSAAMMLDYLGYGEEARAIERAVEEVLHEGVRTPDLGGSETTEGVAEAIAKRVATE